MWRRIALLSLVVGVLFFSSAGFAAPQVLEVSPTFLGFSASAGGANPASQVLSIWNSGHGPMGWTVTEDCNWMVVDPNSGSSSGEIDDVNVIVDISGLAAGSYNCQLTVDAGTAVNSPQTVAVNLELYGGVLRVPSEYGTIQAAIDAATDYNIIIVDEGTYTGDGNRDLDFGGKAIIVRSANPEDPCVVAATVIDCEDSGRGFVFNSAEGRGSVLAGLTIINGYKYGAGGGAIYCSGSSPKIRKCVIMNNSCYYSGGNSNNISGGGIYCSGSSPIIDNCVISDNSCSASYYNYARGGGIYFSGGSPTVSGCTITNNSTMVSGRERHGGGIYCSGTANLVISNCVISNNDAKEYGGGLYCNNSSITISNSIISGNWSRMGAGGLHLQGCPSTINGCTIVANETQYGDGGAIYNSSGTASLSNSIIWDNLTGGSLSDPLEGFSTGEVTYSDVQGGFTGTGNIDTDPLFVDAAVGDYHLAGQSPCIDAGDPSYNPSPGETDIDGDPRILNGRIDIGVDEFIDNGPVIKISPTELHFSTDEVDVNPETQVLTIRNIGTGTMSWEITEDCPWLEVDPNSGESSGDVNEVTVSVDTSEVNSVSQSYELIITAEGVINSPQTVEVSLLINVPKIEVSSNEFEFFAYEGGANPAEQILGISNIGTGTLNWEISEDCNWLSAEPNSGSSTGEVDDVNLSVDIAGLGVGVYDCNLTISDGNAINNPQIVRATLSVTPIGERIIFVDADTPDNNDGSSWNHALKYLQDALETAGSGSIIWVAEGTYHPDSNSANPDGNRDRTATFQLINNVEIHGGYAGNGEPDPNLRDVELYETILSGDLDDNDGEVSKTEDLLSDPNRPENSYHVVTASGTDMTAILDGFTIKGGNANGVDPNNDKGGGLYNEFGGPTIRDCKFTNNSARAKDGNGADRINGDPGYGGGFYNNGGSLTLTGCTFVGNAVRGGDNSGSGSGDGDGGHSYGGGMYSKNAILVLVNCMFSNNLALGGNGNNYVLCKGGNGYGSGLYYSDGTITLTNSTFTDNLAKGGETGDNTSSGYGAGLFSSAAASGSTITDCNFSSNTSHRGVGGGIYFSWSSPMISNSYFLDNNGGGICCSVSSPAINNCTFSGNSAYFTSGKGGGMRNVSNSAPTLTNCQFIGNSAGYGGGMYNDDSDPTVTNCLFRGNLGTFGSGGGGGMYNYDSSRPTLTGCEFIENSATYGAGICQEYSILTLTNCIFLGNLASSTGGGISGSLCSMTLTNCTFADNSATSGMAIASDRNVSPTGGSNIELSNCILWDGGGEILADGYAYVAVSYSNIEGGWSGPGTNNINQNPLFVSGPWGDYYLSQIAAGQAVDSPCVDAGSDTAANLGMNIFTTRTDHVADEGIVDMGYHYPMPNPADINGDGYIDLVDFAILASQWRQAPGVPSADIMPPGGDNIVDFLDVGLLFDYWLW